MVSFTRYQTFVIALIAFLQFTVVLDFMIISPLGVMVLSDLKISTAQFGLVVSVYAFSAGGAGILAAGFADRFDRKRMLLFFYAGFVVGTVLCGISPSYAFLLGARIVTGLFGGVIGSIGLAIIADLFPLEARGRVMGFVMTAFGASQVLGIPIGLLIANKGDWRLPFLAIAAVSIVVGAAIILYMRPIRAHLVGGAEKSPLRHLQATVVRPRYIMGFLATMLLATGGFMLMPFGSTFTVNNLGIPLSDLPIVYVATGTTFLVAGPLLGRLSDAMGKYALFCAGSGVTILVVLYYTELGPTALPIVILLNMVLFVGINARIIPAQALLTAVPALKDRGAFMSINSAFQQLAGGVASLLAGTIVAQRPDGTLSGYPELGFVVCAATVVAVILMYGIHRMVGRSDKSAGPAAQAAATPVAASE